MKNGGQFNNVWLNYFVPGSIAAVTVPCVAPLYGSNSTEQYRSPNGL